MKKRKLIDLPKPTLELLARCAAALKPPPAMTLSEWADRYRVLSAESSAEPGRWHTDKAPYQREIMDAIGDPHIRKVVIMSACIDTGGHHTDQVYRFTAERWERKIWSIKGKGGADVPYIRNPTTNNRVKTPLFIIGVDAGKALLYQRLRHETKGPNYCHFPLNEEAGYDEQYFVGLTAEKMVVRWRKGRSVVAWELKDSKHKRNEPLDLRNYATAALEIANPVLQEGEIAKPIRKRPAGRRRRGGI